MKKLLIVLALVATGTLVNVTPPTAAAPCSGNKVVTTQDCETGTNTNKTTEIN